MVEKYESMRVSGGKKRTVFTKGADMQESRHPCTSHVDPTAVLWTPVSLRTPTSRLLQEDKGKCQAGKLFLCPLRLHLGACELNKQKINRRKGTEFLLIFLCMDVHSKEVKFKVMIRFRGVCTLLNKGPVVWVQGPKIVGK